MFTEITLGYTLLTFGGLGPLWGMGVKSRIAVMLNP